MARSLMSYSPSVEPLIKFPVTCPQCGAEQLAALPVNEVADSLIKGADLRLSTKCHGVIWNATALELQQIRQYLGAVNPHWL